MVAAIVIDPAAQMTLRGALALLFLFAAVHKLRYPRGFREALAGYELVPAAWHAPVAMLLVGLELAVGASLLIPGLAPAGGAAAAGVLTLYTAAVTINLYRGRRDIDCGCAGPAGRVPLNRGLVIRNAFLIAASVACALPADGRPLAWLDIVTIASGLLALSLVYIAADTALANWAGLSKSAERTERLSWSTP